MELLKRWWIVLRRRWLVVAVYLVVAVVGVSAYNVTAHKEYTATTVFLRAPMSRHRPARLPGATSSRGNVF